MIERERLRRENRERRQRENGKGDVYNLGPRWQLRGSRYAKKGLPHGIRISSRSHLNFNLGDAARTLFGTVFSPLGAPGLSACLPIPRTFSGKVLGKGLRNTRCSGARRDKKRRARELCALLKIGCVYLTRKHRVTMEKEKESADAPH